MRKTVVIVAVLNLLYFGVEFAVAHRIRSVSLFADSVDFLEDASTNLLILAGLEWSASRRSKLGMVLSAIILVPAFATLWTAWRKFWTPAAPAPLPLSLTGFGALDVNLTCSLLLARYRRHESSLMRAAFLSSRNDVIANILIVAAGLVTSLAPSAWPDFLVGLGIAGMNANAAHEVYLAARREGETPEAG